MLALFEDRVPGTKGKMKVTHLSDNSVESVIVERDDDPVIPGTSMTADVMNAIVNEINNRQNIKIQVVDNIAYITW